MQAAVGVKAGLYLRPYDLPFEIEFAQQRTQGAIGIQRDVIMSVPRDVADLPSGREPADLRSGFYDGHGRAALGQAQRKRQAEQAAADDRDSSARSSFGRVARGGEAHVATAQGTEAVLRTYARRVARASVGA